MPALFIVTIEHIPNKDHIPLQWRHNDHDGVSNHQPHDCFAVSLICTWINGWVNNRETGDLKRHRAHYDVIVMQPSATTGTTNQGSAPKRVGVRGPRGEFSPQPEYPRGEFSPQPEYQIFTKITPKEWLHLKISQILPHQNVKKKKKKSAYLFISTRYAYTYLVSLNFIPGTAINYQNQWWFIVLTNKLQQWNSNRNTKPIKIIRTKTTHNKATFLFLCNSWDVFYLVREALQLTNDSFCKAIQGFVV